MIIAVIKSIDILEWENEPFDPSDINISTNCL